MSPSFFFERRTSILHQPVNVVLGAVFGGGHFEDVGHALERLLRVPIRHHLRRQKKKMKRDVQTDGQVFYPDEIGGKSPKKKEKNKTQITDKKKRSHNDRLPVRW